MDGDSTSGFQKWLWLWKPGIITLAVAGAAAAAWYYVRPMLEEQSMTGLFSKSLH